jgi:hypothetical protein
MVDAVISFRTNSGWLGTKSVNITLLTTNKFKDSAGHEGSAYGTWSYQHGF